MNDGKFEPTTATVGELLDKWLEAATVSQRPRTLEENRRKIEHRIRPKLGSVRLNKLTPALLDTAYRAMARRRPVAGDGAQVPLDPRARPVARRSSGGG